VLQFIVQLHLSFLITVFISSTFVTCFVSDDDVEGTLKLKK